MGKECEGVGHGERMLGAAIWAMGGGSLAVVLALLFILKALSVRNGVVMAALIAVHHM